MLISHEVPRSLLKESLKFNDYDYFLIHLYKKYDEYKDFYNLCKKLNRKIILDNSACELRGQVEFNFDEYAYYVKTLEPDEYIIPDVFNDYSKNISYFQKWIEKYNDLKGKKIVTIHGSTEDEMIKSYNYFKKFDVKIAINFDECVYKQYNFDDNINLNKMLNRIHFIYKLVNKNIIDESKEHHLLGCHLPQEFFAYKNMEWIKTIDTSNPIMSALEGIKYNDTKGLIYKPKLNIDNTQDYIDISGDILYNIYYNVLTFRKICE